MDFEILEKDKSIVSYDHMESDLFDYSEKKRDFYGEEKVIFTNRSGSIIEIPKGLYSIMGLGEVMSIHKWTMICDICDSEYCVKHYKNIDLKKI